MGETIKNCFVKITKEPVLLIKGKTGYHLSIKRFILVNNTTSVTSVNVFMLNENDERHYLERNITLVPKTELELFNNKTITINRLDRIFIETTKSTEITASCYYIEKMINVNQVMVLFTDQFGNNCSDISYSIDNSPTDVNRKIITIIENEDYLNIIPTEYEINANFVTVFKNTNDFEVISEYGCVSTSDRYVVTLFQVNYASIDDVTEVSSFRVNILQEGEYWRYRNVNEETFSDWLEINVTHQIMPGDYIIEFEALEGFDTVSFEFTAKRNVFYDFKFDFDHNITDKTTVCIQPSDFINESDIPGVRWRIVNQTQTLNYNDIVEDIPAGEYTIEIQKLDGYFDTYTDKITVYDKQKTVYIINDELIRNSVPSVNYFFPEKVIIVFNVIRKPVLSLTVEPTSIKDSQWRLIYSSGVTTNWKYQSEIIKIGMDIYQLEFSEVDKYMKPDNYTISVPVTTVEQKIKCIYTELQMSNLKISFTIPNKYSQYLFWCLVKPDDDEEILVANWNSNINYEEILQNGSYQLKIKEVVFGETVGVTTYDPTTGLIIPNRTLIEEQVIDINLTEDTVIEQVLITG